MLLISGLWGTGLALLLKLWQYTITRDRVFWMEWLSTLVLIVGVVLTSFNIFPINIYFSLAGNAGWAVVSIVWKKWSLLVIQTVVTVIYTIGIVSHYAN